MIDPAGAELAAKIHQFERLLGDTLAAAGEVNIAAIRARTAHRISSTVGHSFFTEIDQAASAVVAALGHTARGHRIAEQVGRRMGVPTAYGDVGKDPADKVFGGA